MSWRPQHSVAIIAGTPPGGGLDRVARALAQTIAAAHLLDVAVDVVNVPGDGARRAWANIDKHRGDGHVIAISSPNLTSDHLVGLADFDHSRYTPIATLVTEYIAFAVAAGSPLHSGRDLIRRLAQEPSRLTVALATARGNPNHVALAKLVRHAGGDVNAVSICVFDTALDAVADVVAGRADVAAVTAASVIAELEAGRVRLLAISAPTRLENHFAETPTWIEQSVDCVMGAWRGITGPASLGSAQIAFWEDVVRAVTQEPVWQAELERHAWSPMYQDGAALRDYLERERDEFASVLGELGLLREPRAEAMSR